jgi:DNA-binding response OmpR family regulator
MNIPSTPMPNPTTAIDYAQTRVLIVEPDRNYLSVLARRIAQAGYRIASATGAQEALAEMHRAAPDVLIGELTMRGTSGVELVSMVRGDPSHSDLPIIMMGGRSEAIAAVRALHAGADDVVRKPFHFEVLIARIARQIARARSVRELRDANAALDARVVTRAIAVGELTERLQASEAECRRLESMVRNSA